MRLKNIAVSRDVDGIDVSVTLRFMPDDAIGMTAAVEQTMVEAFEVALRHAEAFGEPEGQHKEAEPCAPQKPTRTPRSGSATTAASTETTTGTRTRSAPAAQSTDAPAPTSRRRAPAPSAEASPAPAEKPSEKELGASRRGRRVADPTPAAAPSAAGATAPETPAGETAARPRGRQPRQATATGATASSGAANATPASPATSTASKRETSSLPTTVDVSKALSLAGSKIGPKLVKAYAEEWGISAAADVPEMSRREFIDGLDELVKANGG